MTKALAFVGAGKGNQAHRHFLDVVVPLRSCQRASPVLGVGHDEAPLAASPSTQ